MQIQKTRPAPVAQVTGMGAIAHSDGVFFRVWAPHADKVFVIGDFNDWSHDAHPLRHEEGGYWGGHAPEAKPGDAYKYRLLTPYGELFRNDPYARELTNSIGNSLVVDPADFDWETDTDYQMPSWNRLVVYELHIGTFNAKEKDQPGDFYSAIERLDYLQKLGINAVEIMPIAEFPGDFSWGYNPAHPFAVESRYGGVKGFKEFVKAAHLRGIAVILDVVYNHFGPTDMDLWKFDGWSENDKGGIYFYNDWRSTTPWGDTRPDYGRSEVQQYLRDNALMWIDEYHVDGLRMDMVPYIRNVHADENPDNDLVEGSRLIQRINSEIREKYPWKFTVAEDLHSLDLITASIEDGGLGYSSQWDADFVHPIRQALIAQHDDERDMNAVANALLSTYNGDAFQRVIYTESHDEVANGKSRVAEEIADGDVNNYFSKKRSTLGIALVLTAPGVPMIFQGHELLEDKWFSDTDPIDWKRFKEFRGIVKLHRDLISLRLDRQGFTRGLTGHNTGLLTIDNEQKVIAFHRWGECGPGDSTLVVLNFSNNPIEDYYLPVPTGGLWRVRFNSDWEGYDQEFANDQTSLDTEAEPADEGFVARVSVAAYSAVVLSQDPA
ncbi:MAG: alpha amylase C-terminal domain-containing protein [Cytophagaceae bacterium]|nr:alpha amylase C-terminal domain-containing protein [Cytophagaceae bacterium]